jgi:hypothetical protein
MEKDLFSSLSKNYNELLPPNEESLLLIVWLHQKIEKGYLSEDFEIKDFEDTIEDVEQFLQKGSIQKETLSKKLSSHFYITESRGNKYYIHLTVYAKDLCRLLVNQVQPEIKKLELFHVFKRTLPIHDEDVLNINNFTYWFKNNFLPARREIFGHTESLQIAIEEKINELRVLLKPGVQNPKELIGSFIDIFANLEKQTIGLINTLDYKNDTITKIKYARNTFTVSEELFNEFDKMYREIDSFFQSIDRRIFSINERIQLASKRLRNLLDTLKHKQLFKIKIEQLLIYLIRNSRNEKGEIKLPDEFTKRYLPFYYHKFIAIPKIDFQFYAKAEPEKPERDNEQEAKDRKKSTDLLDVQEATSKWLDEINSAMATGKNIVFDQWLDTIMEKENNLEVPIQVCFGLIQQMNKSKDKEIIVTKEEITKKHLDLTLWKMSIQTTNS